MRASRWIQFLAVAAGMAANAAAFGAGVTFTPILVQGAQAPGQDPGVTINTVGNVPMVGDGGHVVTDFVRLTGPGITGSNDHIGYTGLPGSLSIFQRGGAPAGPLGPDTVFSNQAGGFKGKPNIAGDFAFMQILNGAGVDSTNDTAVFLRQGGVTSVLFREGSPLPVLMDGEVASNFPGNSSQLVRLLNDGSMRAIVQMAGPPGTSWGHVYAGPVASPSLQLAWGAPPPGCSEALDFLDIYQSNSKHRFSSSGNFIVLGSLAGAPSSSNDAFWVGDGSTVALWLREGGSLPGIDPANVVVFGGDFGYSINDSGEALAALRLQTGVGDTLSTNDRILVYGAASSLSVVARENDQVPGLPAGVLYNGFTWNSVYNGGILVGATLRGAVTAADDEVIMQGVPGSLSIAMREGDPAPGFPAGYTLGSFAINADSMKMNQSGQFTLLVTVLTDTATSLRAIYAGAPGSAPQLVCAWDSILEVAPGDFRVVGRSTFSVDNLTGNINALGQITFNAQFTDNSVASMIANVSFTPGPSFTAAAAPMVLDSTGNGDGAADPAESMIALTIPLRNDGALGATGVTATLTSLTPTVTVQTASAAYPDLASGATGGNSAPFIISVSPSHPCGANAIFRLQVTSNEGQSDVSVLLPTGLNYPGCAVFTAGPIVLSDSSGNGNANGIADPGESAISLSIPVNKSGGTGLSTAVSATLTTTTPTATIVTGVAAYPDIAGGATESNSTPFVLSLDPTHPCGAPVNLRLNLIADGGLGHAQLDMTMNGGVPAATTASVRSSIGASIPDNDPNGVIVNFAVSGVVVPVTDVDFRFDGTTASTSVNTAFTGLGHANVGDLIITLTSPDPDGDGPMTGITVVLANHPGPDSSANNLRQCTFDDGAATSIQDIGNPAGPISGSFRPVDPLSVFNGLTGSAVNGVWVLRVADTVESIGGIAGGQGGFCRNATLLISNAEVCVPPGCSADFNNSGGISVQDIFDFLAAYFTGC